MCLCVIVNVAVCVWMWLWPVPCLPGLTCMSPCVVLHSRNEVYSAVTMWTCLWHACVVLHSRNEVYSAVCVWTWLWHMHVLCFTQGMMFSNYSAVTVWTCLWHVCVLQSVCERGSDICMCCASLKEWYVLCSLCVWMLLWPVPCWVDLTWCWCCWTPRMRTGTRWCPPSSWRTKIPWVMPKTLQTMLAWSFFRPA